jgi:hypothetical protein
MSGCSAQKAEQCGLARCRWEYRVTRDWAGLCRGPLTLGDGGGDPRLDTVGRCIVVMLAHPSL